VGHAAPTDSAAPPGVLTVRLAVLTIALLFIAALAVLTVRDIQTHGVTPVAVLAVIIVVLFTTGILGALLNPPKQ
jgi:hypothetical protein